jgi:hypothetical protein
MLRAVRKGRSRADGKLGENGGGGPSRDRGDLVVEEMEELFVIFRVFFDELLGKCFSYTRSVRCCVERGAGMASVRMGCGCGRQGRAVRPNGVDLTVETESDAAWIDEEIKLGISEGLNPIEPLDIGSGTGRPDGIWRKTRRREGDASEGRATKRVGWAPRGGVVRGEIGIEGSLQGEDGVWGIRG